MRIILLLPCWLVLFVEVLASGTQKVLTVSGSPFAISPERNIEVIWKGEKLISGDMHSWLASQNVGAAAEHFEVSGRTTASGPLGISRHSEVSEQFETSNHIQASSEKGWQYTNAWSTDSQLPFRREVGISPDGKKIEINFQSHQDALMDSYPSDTIFYRMYLPLSTLGNCKWEALTGRSYNATWSSGTLNAETPDGDIVGALARWISFTTPEGKITFDLNPHGLTTYYVAAANNINSQWSVKKRGDRIEMTLAVPATNYGGALTGKVNIFEGDRSDYLEHHAVNYYHYFSEIPAERLFCFGGKSSEDFINAGREAYDESKGYGWMDAGDLHLAGGELSGAIYTAATSSLGNTFTTTNLRPGLYLVTIRSSALEQNAGPFHVALNGEEVFSNISIDKGSVANLTCVRWIEGGKADIKLKGEWALSILGYQLFMHTDEDFNFRRGFWLKSDGYCPDVMFSNYYDTPPVYGKSVTKIPLAGSVEEIKEIPELPELETVLPDQESEKLSWRYTSPLGTMGPSNYGSFNEFNTPALIRKRLEQVRNGGVEAVILNGLLSRHTFPAHLERVEENIRQTVEIGHEMGMKFLDHQDLTILWNMDMGFRFLAEHPGFLQHNHTEGLPTWGICPINPLFKEGYFFPYILEHIRKTDLDGLMVDEITFHRNNFCNCIYCREAFTEATNLVLPDDETSPLLRNRSSQLWKAWIEWRKHAIAQWRIDFSKAIQEINPDFCNIQYYSEGGFIRDGASYEQGGDLALSARSMDFLGTEIMSRDVWDNYRYNFSSRHLYNSLNETFESPVFGLVYPIGQINYAILGWAMNNMVGQVTWSMIDFKGSEKMNQYTGWKENMNNRSARPFADIAIIFSRRTRDWSPENKDTYPQEIMGISQLLTAVHIQYTVILDDALLNQDISRFRVLLAPSLECISDLQVDKLREFVLNGGTLYITGDAGSFTSYGESRTRRVFIDWFEKEGMNISDHAAVVQANPGKGRVIYCAERLGLNDFCKSHTIGNTYEYLPDTSLTAFHEKVLRQVIGKELSFEAIAMPAKLLTSVYRESRNGKDITLVHLLNATGVKVKNGDVLPLPGPEWGEIKGDLVFEISLPSISKSYYATPDAPGHRPVRVKKVGEGRYRIIIPEGTVEKYGIVYLLN